MFDTKDRVAALEERVADLSGRVRDLVDLRARCHALEDQLGPVTYVPMVGRHGRDVGMCPLSVADMMAYLLTEDDLVWRDASLEARPKGKK
jgi:hypothetical protein